MDKFNFFSQFSPVSTQQWKQKIQYELDGKDYNEHCVWQSHQQIVINPFYNRETTPNIRFFSDKKTTLLIPITENSVEKCLDKLNQSAAYQYFVINQLDTDNLSSFLEKSSCNRHFFSIIHELLPLHKLEWFSKFQNNILCFDPIGNLSRTGNFFGTKKDDLSIWKSIFYQTKHIFIDASVFAESGATHLQQIAYSMAVLNDYLSGLEDISHPFVVTIQLSIHPEFYLEIAKIRAIRWVFASIFNNYKNMNLRIITKPSQRYMSLLKGDEKQNEIRSQWCAQSAVLAGTDYLIPQTYTSMQTHSITDFEIFCDDLCKNISEQWTNNAFYFDAITYQMTQKALALWQQIVTNGGFLKQLKNHIIQRKIKEKSQAEITHFYNNRTLIQTQLQPFAKELLWQKNKQKTLLEPLLPKRMTELYERKLVKNETH